MVTRITAAWAGIVLILTTSSTDAAVIQLVQQRLRASASAYVLGDYDIDNPPDVLGGSAYGTYRISAKASAYYEYPQPPYETASPSGSASMTLTTSDGRIEANGGATITNRGIFDDSASAGASTVITFELAAPTQVRFTYSLFPNMYGAPSGTALLKQDGATRWVADMNGDPETPGTFERLVTIAPGRYDLEVGAWAGYAMEMAQPGSIQLVMEVVPEPHAIGLASLALLLLRRRSV